MAELMSDHKSDKAIAVALGISTHTVKIHVHHVLEKLALNRRSEARNILMGVGFAGLKARRRAEDIGGSAEGLLVRRMTSRQAIVASGTPRRRVLVCVGNMAWPEAEDVSHDETKCIDEGSTRHDRLPTHHPRRSFDPSVRAPDPYPVGVSPILNQDMWWGGRQQF